MADFDTASVREAFAKLKAEIEAIESKSGPLRAKMDKIWNDAKTEVLKVKAEVDKIEDDLFGKKNSLAGMVRFLNGATGDPNKLAADDAIKADEGN